MRLANTTRRSGVPFLSAIRDLPHRHRETSAHGDDGKRNAALELHPELDAPDARLVDHGGQVVEVDARHGALVVRDVPDEAGDVEAIPLVAEPKAALEQAVVA